jgi:LysR family hydrogen peroxide-inducible transcriptional activator
VRVFERGGRGVLTTRAGEELLGRARRVLLAADELLDAASRYADPLSGTLRIGVIPTVSPYFLPEAAPALRRALPRLAIVWSEDKTAALSLALHKGELDAALVALPAELGAVESQVIGDDRFVLAAPPGHPLAKKSRLKPDELNGVELLVLAEGHCLRDQALAACQEAHHSEFGATSLQTLVQMVAGGAGVTLLPELALPSENQRGMLVVRQFVAPAPGRTLALVWRLESAAKEVLRQIAAVMRKTLAQRQ